MGKVRPPGPASRASRHPPPIPEPSPRAEASPKGPDVPPGAGAPKARLDGRRFAGRAPKLAAGSRCSALDGLLANIEHVMKLAKKAGAGADLHRLADLKQRLLDNQKTICRPSDLRPRILSEIERDFSPLRLKFEMPPTFGDFSDQLAKLKGMPLFASNRSQLEAFHRESEKLMKKSPEEMAAFVLQKYHDKAFTAISRMVLRAPTYREDPFLQRMAETMSHLFFLAVSPH